MVQLCTSQHPPVHSLVLPPQKGPNLPVRALYFRSHDKGSAVPPRVAPSISRSRSESGVYSRAPPVLMPSPLKTVWFVDSTGSIPPSTSGIPLTGHSTPGLLTVSSLPREAARAEHQSPCMTDNFLSQMFSPETLPEKTLTVVTPRMIPHKAVVIHRTTAAYFAVVSGSPANFQCTIISGWYQLALNHLTHIIRQMFNISRITIQAHQP